MPIQIVHSPEPTPEVLTKSLFLAGPSPRKDSDPNWRPAAIEALRLAGFDGTVFVPIPRDGKWPENYNEQMDWERKHLASADVIAMWCPRDLEHLPGFTTNVEFGEWLKSGKLLYGRPEGAPSTRYLDARYNSVHQKLKPPFNAPSDSLESLARQAVGRLGDGAERKGGERSIPLQVWKTSQFQAWYRDLVAAGNRLDDAEVLWTFHIPQANNVVFCYALRVKIWVTTENRHKENEFVVSRADISSICAYHRDPQSHELLDTKIVLVREFRAPGRTADGFVHDLPGGSSFRPTENPLKVAANELKEETGVELAPERFRPIVVRQLNGTFGSHKAHLFAVELTAAELAGLEVIEKSGDSFGVVAETEKTYIEVRTIRQILKQQLLDHACVGMILQTCFEPWIEK